MSASHGRQKGHEGQEGHERDEDVDSHVIAGDESNKVHEDYEGDHDEDGEKGNESHEGDKGHVIEGHEGEVIE